MNLLEKHVHYINLFDFYENALTAKQKLYFKEYYFEDLSLAEIAKNHQISRSAVYDQIQKIHAILDGFEEKFELYLKFQKRNKIFDEYADVDNQEIQQLIEKLKKIEQV